LDYKEEHEKIAEFIAAGPEMLHLLTKVTHAAKAKVGNITDAYFIDNLMPEIKALVRRLTDEE
jgi:hypothetical protein